MNNIFTYQCYLFTLLELFQGFLVLMFITALIMNKPHDRLLLWYWYFLPNQSHCLNICCSETMFSEAHTSKGSGRLKWWMQHFVKLHIFLLFHDEDSNLIPILKYYIQHGSLWPWGKKRYDWLWAILTANSNCLLRGLSRPLGFCFTERIM